MADDQTQMKLTARVLGVLPSGTLPVGPGLAVLGIGSYAQLALAGHGLSTTGMAAMSVLWSIVFWLGLGLFFPVEQEHAHLPLTPRRPILTVQPADSPLPRAPIAPSPRPRTISRASQHMDEVAHELGADPLAFRSQAPGRRPARCGPARRRRPTAGWESARGGGRGLGIACGMEKDGRVATCADASVTPQGRLNTHRIVTAYDCSAIVNPDNVVNQIEVRPSWRSAARCSRPCTSTRARS